EPRDAEAVPVETPEGEEAEQPEQAEQVWPVKFQLLPPVDFRDTHVALPARQVWEQLAGSIGFIGRNAVRLRERLGSELARAVDYCPVLKRAQETKRPEGVLLSTAEAFRFMRDWAEALREAGFEVQLP